MTQRSRSYTPVSAQIRTRAGSVRIRTAIIVHNGEINTIRGNADKMAAREERMASEYMEGDTAQGASGHKCQRV